MASNACAVIATAPDRSQRFSDVPPEHAALAAFGWAVDVGGTNGYGDGTFKPATRSAGDTP